MPPPVTPRDGGDGSNGSGPVGTAGRLPRVWQARLVARMCAEAGLDADRAGFVDAATTPYLGALPWGRFKELVAAKIIEADPDQAEARRRAAAAARFVRTGQSTEHGLKTLVARANAGDVILFVAMADRIAQILYLRGDRDGVDVRRSKAIGILATPARALRLLEETEAFLAAAARTHPWPGTDAPDDPTDGAHADPTPDARPRARTALTPAPRPAPRPARRVGASTGAGSTGASSGASTGESGSTEQSTRDGDHGGTADDPSEPPDADDPDDPEVVGEADVHPSQNDADDPPPDRAGAGAVPVLRRTTRRTIRRATGCSGAVHPTAPDPGAAAAAGRDPVLPPVRGVAAPPGHRGGPVRGRRPGHHRPADRVPRPHQRPGRPGRRPRRPAPGRRLRDPGPDAGRGPAAQPGLHRPVGHQHLPDQGHGTRDPLRAARRRRPARADLAGQPRPAVPVPAPGQDPRRLDPAADRPRRLRMALPARLPVRRRPARHPTPSARPARNSTGRPSRHRHRRRASQRRHRHQSQRCRHASDS